MARRTTETRGHAGAKALGFLTVALLIFWAGHDPAGALAVIRHIAEGIASFADHLHTGGTTKP